MATETTYLNEKDFTQDLSEESVNESEDESDISEYLGSEDETVTRKTSGVTKTIRKTAHPRKKYRCISDSLREKLIDAVENRGLKIKQAAKKLRINYSSAKSIYQVYKKEGRSSKKIMKKRASKSTKDHEDNDEINLKDEDTQSTPASVKVKREVDSELSEDQDINDDRRTAIKNEEYEQTQGSSARYMVKSEEASLVKAEFNNEKPLQQYSHNVNNSNSNQVNANCMPPTNELYVSSVKFEGENSLPQQMIHTPQNLLYPNNIPYQNSNFLASNLPLMGNSLSFGPPQAFNAQNLYMQNLLMNQYPIQYNYINPMLQVNPNQPLPGTLRNQKGTKN